MDNTSRKASRHRAARHRGWTPTRGTDRWVSWRPSVSICQHENLLVHRFELLYGPKEEKLAELVAADIASVSPETEVRSHLVPMKDPWDFEEVYAALHDFARAYPFNTETEEYLVHITTGTHVAQICLFLLTESRHLPGKLLQCSPPARRHQQDPIGSYRIIDLDLSKYDRLATRFALDQQAGHVVPQVGHRHPQRRVQPPDRPDRARGRSPAARRCC